MNKLKDNSVKYSKKSIKKGLWSSFAFLLFSSIYLVSPKFAAGAFIPLIVCVILSQIIAQYIIAIKGQFNSPYFYGLGINTTVSIVVLTLINILLPGFIQL